VLTAWLAKLRLVGERLTAGEVAVPEPDGLDAEPVAVPERLIVWGLPLALSVMLSEADRLPLAVGLKVTLIVQLLPSPTKLLQLLVWKKSPAFVPVIATLVISRIPRPRSLTEMV
jgi:hypothetical protein